MYDRPNLFVCLFPYPKMRRFTKASQNDCPYEQGHSRPLKKKIQKKKKTPPQFWAPRVKIRNVVV